MDRREWLDVVLGTAALLGFEAFFVGLSRLLTGEVFMWRLEESLELSLAMCLVWSLYGVVPFAVLVTRLVGEPYTLWRRLFPAAFVVVGLNYATLAVLSPARDALPVTRHIGAYLVAVAAYYMLLSGGTWLWRVLRSRGEPLAGENPPPILQLPGLRVWTATALLGLLFLLLARL